MNIHELKILPEFYKAVLDGRKTFEIRRNDRDFQVGDILELREWDSVIKWYTGNSIKFVVTYLLTSSEFEGIAEGYCVMGLSGIWQQV